MSKTKGDGSNYINYYDIYLAQYPSYLSYSTLVQINLLWEQGCFSLGVITNIIKVPSVCLMFSRWLKGDSFRRDLEVKHFMREKIKVTKRRVIIRNLKRKNICIEHIT